MSTQTRPPFGYTPRHKVLRYLEQRDIRKSGNRPVGSVIVVDVGTTGLKVEFDHVTELGWMEVGYDARHQICGFNGPYMHKGIFPTTLNLVSDQDQSVGYTHPDLHIFLDRVERAGLIISHNNRFDRPMLEKAIPALANTSAKWACSLHDLDWKSVGTMDNRLCDLLDYYSACHNRHDTEEDVIALTWLLGRCWPETQYNPFPYPRLSIAGKDGRDQECYVTNLSMLIRKAEDEAQQQFRPQFKTPSFGIADF